MAIRALDFMAKVSSRFIHEILPVATASVIGAMLVNHYGRQPASPPIVIQAQASASEDAMVQSLREERELIASFVMRNHERDIDPDRSGSAASQVASAGPTSLPVADPPLPEPRPAAPQKAVARLAPKSAARKKPALTEASSLQLDPPAAASDAPQLLASSAPPPPQDEFEPRVRPIIRVASAFSGWVGDVAQAPALAAFLPRWPDWPSIPPLIRPLSFFREN
jgi:hypothetical protein